jgi:hypothetical protein
MSKARNLADLLDASGDVASGALDNVPPSNDASALTTGTLPIARIADGDITAAKLGSTLDLSGKTVTLPSGVGGKVLQVVYGNTKTEVTVSTTSFTDIGLSASITPLFSSSKVLVICSVQVRVFISTIDNGASLRLLRNGSSILAATNTYQIGYNNRSAFNINSEESYQVPLMFLDSPASTSALTYKIQGQQRYSGSGNRVDFQDDDSYTSNIVLMEIAA